MSFFKTLMVFCLCLISISTANPIQKVQGLDSRPTTQFQTLRRPRFPFAGSSTNEKLCKSSEPSCALHYRAQSLYIWRAGPFELFSPIRCAALVLREFYHTVLVLVNEYLSSRALFPSFWIRRGGLELPLRSVGRPTIWSAVAAFIHEIFCATKVGWIGTYDTMNQNATGNQAVGVIPRTANIQISLPQAHLSRPRTVIEAKGTELNKRNKINTHLQPIFIKKYEIIVPTSLAAHWLKAFFDDIATQATTTWASRTAAPLLTVTQGHFQLTASSVGAEIPWISLANAARHFSLLTSRFWTSTFDAFFELPDSGFRVAFSLRLLDTAAEKLPMTLSVPSERRTTLHAPRNLPPAAPHSTPPPRASIIQSRTPPSPGSSSPKLHVNFIKHIAMLPVAIAAEQLEDFYSVIALKILTGQMAHRSPSKMVTLSIWDFELVFSSETMLVPWSFVQAFAIEMAEWSARSWTGFYEAIVSGEGPLSGMVILVQMRLKDKAL